MMWAFIFASAAVLFLGGLYFFRSKKSRASALPADFVYRELLQLLGENKSSVRSVLNDRRFELGYREGRNKHHFRFNLVQDKLLVVWTFESEFHGRRGKEWSFPGSLPQPEMAGQIIHDVQTYLRGLYRER